MQWIINLTLQANFQQDCVAQTSIKFESQLKLNWHLNLLEMYMILIYT